MVNPDLDIEELLAEFGQGIESDDEEADAPEYPQQKVLGAWRGGPMPMANLPNDQREEMAPAPDRMTQLVWNAMDAEASPRVRTDQRDPGVEVLFRTREELTAISTGFARREFAGTLQEALRSQHAPPPLRCSAMEQHTDPLVSREVAIEDYVYTFNEHCDCQHCQYIRYTTARAIWRQHTGNFFPRRDQMA